MSAQTRAAKTFVVDTNVLLHNPNALFAFAEHHVVIPMVVLEELDRFKAANNELGLVLSKQGRMADSARQFEATAALDPVRRSAPANLLRTGRWVSLVACLILALPLFILSPYGLLAGIGLYALVWNIPLTRRHLEAWTLAYVRWRARRGGPGDAGHHE